MHMNIPHTDTCLPESAIMEAEIEIDRTLGTAGARSRHQLFPGSTLTLLTSHLWVITACVYNYSVFSFLFCAYVCN